MSDIIAPGTTAGANGFYALDRQKHDQGHREHGWDAGDVRGFAASQFAEHSASMRRADADTAAADREAKSAAAFADRQHQALRDAIETHGTSGELATVVAGKDGQLTTEKTGAATMLGISVSGDQVKTLMLQQSNAAAVQAQTNAAAVALAIHVASAASLQQAIRDAAASSLAAATNTASILAAQAECCCELKALVSDEANRTREKMIELDGNGAARREAALAAEVSQLKLVAALGRRGD